MRRRSHFPACICLAFYSVIVTCDAQSIDRTATVVQDSAGIHIITSQAQNEPLQWRFVELFRLGGADSGHESFFSIERRGVSVDPTGNIYVLDRGNKRVLVFERSGRFLRSLGRAGGGPDELQTPVALAVGPDMVPAVLDYSKRGLVRFGADGSARPTRRIELPYGGQRIIATADGLLLDLLEGYRTESPTVQDRLVLLTDSDEVVEIATLKRFRPEYVQYTGCVRIPLNPLFAPELRWDAYRDQLVVSASPAYVIDVYHGTRHVASYRREVKPRQVTRQLALAELGNGRTVTTPMGKCRIEPEEELDGRGFAEVLPTIDELSIAPDGRIWVRRSSFRDEPGETDVLEHDGSYLGTLSPDTPFPVAFLGPDTIITIEPDELDIEYIVAYEVVLN